MEITFFLIKVIVEFLLSWPQRPAPFKSAEYWARRGGGRWRTRTADIHGV